ncbi:MAG: hypothetical protein ACOY3Y_19925 [Acidobacteriota bacterium]
MNPVPLRDVSYLVERGLVGDSHAAYRAVRLGLVPPSCIVRVGRFIRVNPERLEAWIAGGGAVAAPPGATVAEHQAAAAV